MAYAGTAVQALLLVWTALTVVLAYASGFSAQVATMVVMLGIFVYWMIRWGQAEYLSRLPAPRNREWKTHGLREPSSSTSNMPPLQRIIDTSPVLAGISLVCAVGWFAALASGHMEITVLCTQVGLAACAALIAKRRRDWWAERMNSTPVKVPG